MKKYFSSIAVAIAFLGLGSSQANAQYARHFFPIPVAHHHDSEATKQTRTAAHAAVGIASLITDAISHAAEVKAEQEAQARYEQQKAEAKANFPSEVAEADRYFNEGNWSMALQSYANCAHNNDNFGEDLGDQDFLVSRMAECNTKLGSNTSKPGVQNNCKARKSDYSDYTIDIENPVYKSKKNTGNVQITRISRNGKETRIEFEYYNNQCGAAGLSIKGNTYIKGKKSGKLMLRRVENLTLAPSTTTVEYGRQTLKFALIFPAMDESDASFDFREPSSDWQFNNIVCM